MQIIKQEGTYTGGTTYTILEANSVLGTFGSVIQPSGLTLTVAYNDQNIQLSVPYGTINLNGLSGNNRIIASTLNGLVSNSNYSSLVDALSDLSQKPLENALMSISCSRNASSKFILSTTFIQFLDVINQRISYKNFDKFYSSQSKNKEKGLYASLKFLPTSKSKKTENTFYISPFGSFLKKSSQNQTQKFDSKTGGFLMGYDKIFENGLAGINGGYAYSKYDYSSQSGNGDIDTFVLSGYGLCDCKFFQLQLALIGSYNYISQKRKIITPLSTSTAFSTHDAWQLVPHISLSKAFIFKNNVIEPMFAYEYSSLWSEGYQEKNAGALNMKVKHKYTGLSRFQAGFNMYQSWEFSKGIFSMEEGAFYVYQKPNGLDSLTASFVGTNPLFVLNTYSAKQSLFSPVIQLQWKSINNVYISGSYIGQFGSGYIFNQALFSLGKSF